MDKIESTNQEYIEKSTERRKRLLRQINDWIHDDSPYQIDYSTAIGLPTAHIILERRLEQYLFELGKKRQKFINHCDYDKHVFIEKQKRKSSALRRCLSVSDRSSRGWTVGASQDILTREDSWLTQEKGENENNKLDGDSEQNNSFLITQMFNDEQELSKTRLGLMNRGKEGEVVPPKPISRGKSVQFMQSSLYNTTAERSEPIKPPSKPPSKLERLPSIMRERTNSSLPPPVKVPWSLMKSTSIAPNSHLPPLMSDPRYTKLEKLLCATYEDEKFARTAPVTKQLDSLHVSPKIIKKRSSEVDRKIRQFLIERGLIAS